MLIRRGMFNTVCCSEGWGEVDRCLGKNYRKKLTTKLQATSSDSLLYEVNRNTDLQTDAV